MAQPLDHESADGSILVRFRKFYAEAFVELGNRRTRHYPQGPWIDDSSKSLGGIVLVFDIPYYFFDEIFGSEDSRRASIFIDDHRYVLTRTLQRQQHFIERHRFRKITNRPHHLADRRAEIGGFEQIENVNHPNQIGNAAAKHRNAAVSFAAHQFDRGIQMSVLWNRDHLHQRHHRFARFGIGKLENAADHSPFDRKDRIALRTVSTARRAPLEQQLQILAAQKYALNFRRHSNDPPQQSA